MHFASRHCRLDAKLPSRNEMSDAADPHIAGALRRSGLDPSSGPAHERTQEVAWATRCSASVVTERRRAGRCARRVAGRREGRIPLRVPQRGLAAATKGEPRLLEEIYATCGEVGERDSICLRAATLRRGPRLLESGTSTVTVASAPIQFSAPPARQAQDAASCAHRAMARTS